MLATVIITVLLAGAVALIIRSIIRSRKSGGCSSCSDCSACSGCDASDPGVSGVSGVSRGRIS